MGEKIEREAAGLQLEDLYSFFLSILMLKYQNPGMLREANKSKDFFLKKRVPTKTTFSGYS